MSGQLQAPYPMCRDRSTAFSTLGLTRQHQRQFLQQPPQRQSQRRCQLQCPGPNQLQTAVLKRRRKPAPIVESGTTQKKLTNSIGDAFPEQPQRARRALPKLLMATTICTSRPPTPKRETRPSWRRRPSLWQQTWPCGFSTTCGQSGTHQTWAR